MFLICFFSTAFLKPFHRAFHLLQNPNLIAISSSRNRSPSSQNPIAAVLLQPSFSIGVLFIFHKVCYSLPVAILIFPEISSSITLITWSSPSESISRNRSSNSFSEIESQMLLYCCTGRVCLFVFACLMLLSTTHPLLVKSGKGMDFLLNVAWISCSYTFFYISTVA
jgi:hypothetical protein